MTDTETTIVGAGPYGLSIAAYLREANLPFQMFGTPMESWRRYMPEGMVLKSERMASNLWDPSRRFTFERYCAEKGMRYQPIGDPLSMAAFLDYAEWFQQRATPEPRDVRIVRVHRNGKRFSLHLADGTNFTSRRVILATGHMAFRKVPEQLQKLSEPELLHTTDIQDVKRFDGRDVTIVGAGQAALETAALLHEAGARVRIVVKAPHVEWNDISKPRPLISRMIRPDAGIGSGWRSWSVSEMPQVFRWYFPADKRHRFVAKAYGASGAWWLRDRVDRRIELRLNCVIETAARNGGNLHVTARGPEGTSEFSTDHIVAGTGFKVDVDRLNYLDTDIRQSIAREKGGYPALDPHFETSVPGLFIVGIASAPVFGPIMRFMYGAKHVAPTITRHIKSSPN
jgi:thioredoxin reductase